MTDIDRTLTAYSDLAIRGALNLQPGQHLLILGPLATGGVSLEAAPLVRCVTASAYRAGARLVEALWGDEAMQLVRFEDAPDESFATCSGWLPDALVAHVTAGHAVLSIYANDPDLLSGQPPARVGALQQAIAQGVRPFRELISRNETNWAVIAAPALGWAARVFPHLPPGDRMAALWEAIIPLCRLDRPDPLDAWNVHLVALARRRDYLNAKRFSALRYRGPGTDLTVGLAPGHLWVSGRSTSRSGIEFAPNLPTEEVFTMPDRNRVDGTVRATKPLGYGGTLIEDFTLRFSAGHVTSLSAARGETVLRQLVDTDKGAGSLGEVALVPASSPVARSGLLFYNTLFDENAATHVALGSAYKFTLAGGETMSDDEFERSGGNRSAVHVDFMIGSAELDIDGISSEGLVEPLMRGGEWAQPEIP